MDEPTMSDMFRRAPVEHAIAVCVPLTVAGGQLFNSAFTGFPFVLSVPLAGVMVAFAWLLTGYNYARYRRRQLESLRSEARA